MNDKRKSYSKEDKLSLLRDYYQSGLSKNSFCKSRGIAAVKSLNTWLKVFANEKDLTFPDFSRHFFTEKAKRDGCVSGSAFIPCIIQKKTVTAD